MSLELIVTALKVVVFIVLYFMIGFGPGFIIGMILANFVFGRNKPLRMEKHQENIKKAGEHNKQWHPENEKWQ